jgi:hypothetical protein
VIVDVFLLTDDLGDIVRGKADSPPASIPLEVYFKENIPAKESA